MNCKTKTCYFTCPCIIPIYVCDSVVCCAPMLAIDISIIAIAIDVSTIVVSPRRSYATFILVNTPLVSRLCCNNIARGESITFAVTQMTNVCVHSANHRRHGDMCMLRALCARVSLNPFSQSSDACFSSWFVLASLHHWTSDSGNSRYGRARSRCFCTLQRLRE